MYKQIYNNTYFSYFVFSAIIIAALLGAFDAFDCSNF